MCKRKLTRLPLQPKSVRADKLTPWLFYRTWRRKIPPPPLQKKKNRKTHKTPFNQPL